MIGYLYRLNHASDRLQVAAVKTPFARSDDQQAGLTDMAILTGGQVLTTASGRTLAGIQFIDLGQVGAPGQISTTLALSVGREMRANCDGISACCKTIILKKRTWTNGAAYWEELDIYWAAPRYLCGGYAEPEIEARKEIAERTGSALRSAMGSGFVPGGGLALLGCQSVLNGPFEENDPLEKRAAFRILSRALEEPMRTILINSGLELEDWLVPFGRLVQG